MPIPIVPSRLAKYLGRSGGLDGSQARASHPLQHRIRHGSLSLLVHGFLTAGGLSQPAPTTPDHNLYYVLLF